MTHWLLSIVGSDGKADTKEVAKRVAAQEDEKKRDEFLQAIKGRKSTQVCHKCLFEQMSITEMYFIWRPDRPSLKLLKANATVAQ
jgi:hypothetical protein